VFRVAIIPLAAVLMAATSWAAEERPQPAVRLAQMGNVLSCRLKCAKKFDACLQVQPEAQDRLRLTMACNIGKLECFEGC
jgi:hypothetical protein